MKKKVEANATTPLMAVAFIASPIIVLVADVWVSFWFYATYAIGTWMAGPTIITALGLALVCVLSFIVIISSLDSKS